MKKILAAVLFLLLVPVHAATDAGPSDIAGALRASARQHRPVLIDFHAAWCYSCYYMASHVLNGPDWAAVRRRAIVVDADADSPDGQAWMNKLRVSFLPSYVVLDEHGDELGRIAAEQPRRTFYSRIDAILAHGDTLAVLKASAAKGSVDAAVQVLDAYQARSEGAAGLAWFDALPPSFRKRAAQNADVNLALERLALAKAVASHDEPAVIASAGKVLAGDIGCDRPYVLDDLLQASKALPEARRRALLAAQRQPLDRYLDSRVFVAAPTCADQRSAVLASADLDAALGDPAAESAVLDRAIRLDRQRLGADLASDRNLADVLRVYLERARRAAELDHYLQQLIAAYPDDYVYAYRYGRRLLAAGQPAQALPWLQKAADKAYGANRLAVAEVRVKALKALNRQADAEKVVAEALKQNGPWFPEQVAKLKAALG